ncbi:hypothetical protein COC50_21745 [Bacillus anthracis]|nr:hypothetical protein COC50_21745 [Bacillus anthracis]
MRNRLIGKEKQFLTDVLKELKQYDISLEERENIKRQILEHIQECREHGEDSIDDLGTPQLFVQDFIEINEIDLQVKMKQFQNEKGYLTGYQSWFGIPRKSVVSYDNAGAPYGYITANLEDMIQFIMFLNRQENPQFLKQENMDLYLSPLYKINSEKSYGFGLRTTNINESETMIWHSGSTPDARAEIFTLNKSGWSGVILTNKNHVLEETALSELKKGIISILNGEEPVDIPKNIPLIQIVLLLVTLILFIISIMLIKKYKHMKSVKKLIWLFIGSLSLLLSIIFIPLLTYSTSSPWRTIKIFAADIGLLTSIIVILLAVNGLLSIFIGLRRKRVYE